MENITFRPASPMLYDKLHTLAAEYSVPVDLIVNLAVKRLINDIEVIRDLRTGKADLR